MIIANLIIMMGMFGRLPANHWKHLGCQGAVFAPHGLHVPYPREGAVCRGKEGQMGAANSHSHCTNMGPVQICPLLQVGTLEVALDLCL